MTLRKTALNLAHVFLKPPNHHVVERLLTDGHTPAEPLRIENFEQGRKTVRMAVVGRGGKK